MCGRAGWSPTKVSNQAAAKKCFLPLESHSNGTGQLREHHCACDAHLDFVSQRNKCRMSVRAQLSPNGLALEHRLKHCAPTVLARSSVINYKQRGFIEGALRYLCTNMSGAVNRCETTVIQSLCACADQVGAHM